MLVQTIFFIPGFGNETGTLLPELIPAIAFEQEPQAVFKVIIGGKVAEPRRKVFRIQRR